MKLLSERLRDVWTWWRIAERGWRDPLDPSFAAHRGGRWNPPGSFATLYLNEDRVTARLNLRAFIAQWPYEPEDLRAETGPVLVGVSLPRSQDVADLHSRAGIAAARLPATYPLDSSGARIAHARCQPIGRHAKDADLRGVRARSARSPEGAGRELAWFPATARSRATETTRMSFEDWYWS